MESLLHSRPPSRLKAMGQSPGFSDNKQFNVLKKGEERKQGAS